MKEIYWVIKNQLAGRCGPDYVNWNLEELRSAGFRTIVSFDASGINHNEIVSNGFNHYEFYTRDIVPIYKDDIELFIEYIEEFIYICDHPEKDHKPILIHCFAGLDRSPAVIICYLIYKGIIKTLDEAIAFLKNIHPMPKWLFCHRDILKVIDIYLNNVNLNQKTKNRSTYKYDFLDYYLLHSLMRPTTLLKNVENMRLNFETKKK